MPDEPIPVRLSHLLRYCAVGAVVRGPDYLVTVQDTNAWNCGPDHEIRYVDQVRAALGLAKMLRSPPTARVENGELMGRPIPATRFPGWMRCSRCGLLHHQPWSDAAAENMDARSPSSGNGWTCAVREDRPCRGRLEQAPWVLAHDRGYLADVPWHWLAHAGSQHPVRRTCPADWQRPYLRVVAAARPVRGLDVAAAVVSGTPAGAAGRTGLGAADQRRARPCPGDRQRTGDTTRVAHPPGYGGRSPVRQHRETERDSRGSSWLAPEDGVAASREGTWLYAGRGRAGSGRD